MSATGKTPNYNLAVYRDYDITSYLTDFNGNMEAIDTALKALSDKITGGEGAIGAPTDFVASTSTPVTIRNNTSGSTTALLTIANVVPAQYAISGYVEADTSTLTADNIYATVTINIAGTPTPFILKLTKTAIANTYSFNTPITATQKGYITLEANLDTNVNNSIIISRAAMSLQKLDV